MGYASLLREIVRAGAYMMRQGDVCSIRGNDGRELVVYSENGSRMQRLSFGILDELHWSGLVYQDGVDEDGQGTIFRLTRVRGP